MVSREKIAELLRRPPPIHLTGDGTLTNWAIDSGLVPHLERFVRPGTRTLETGSGTSTIVLLALGADHRAISPDPGEPERIRAYCDEKGISTATYTHIVEKSEQYLPSFHDETGFDLVLVDGDHAFPIPYIDWFYAGRLLKKGGIAIIDDINLWSCRILADFLVGDDAWETIERTPRFAIFRLLSEPEEAFSRWWSQQPYVAANSADLGSRRSILSRLRGR